jgi:Ca2+-binding EF-hand superfamily protein
MKRSTVFGSVLAAAGLVVLGLSAASSFAQSAGPMGGGGPAAMVKLADTNGDGVISADEIQAHQLARFAQMDADHDGQLTSDELGPPIPPGGGQRPGMMNNVRREEMRDQRHAQMLQQMDSDHNGAVSKDEFTAFEGHRMMALDTNNDGQIDQDELQAMQRAMPSRMPPSQN